MGEHKNNQNARLAAAGQLTKPDTTNRPIQVNIAINKTTGRVVIIYNQQINNAQYTLPQLAHHLGALVHSARMIDPTFMSEEITLK